ncbi:MAG TPA: hypothetical protein VGU20_13765 [Stellaceae bacterium]|nr:hypothetical protein [Stellaceae bacterium]
MLSPRDKKRLARAERSLAILSISVRSNPRTDTFQLVDEIDGSLIHDDVEFSFTEPLVTRAPMAKLYAMTLNDVVEFVAP